MNNCQLCIVDKLITKVSEIHKLDPKEVFTSNRKTEYCVARGLVLAVLVTDLSLTYRALGKQFNRNPKSIHFVVRTLREEKKVNKQREAEYQQLVKVVNEPITL